MRLEEPTLFWPQVLSFLRQEQQPSWQEQRPSWQEQQPSWQEQQPS